MRLDVSRIGSMGVHSIIAFGFMQILDKMVMRADKKNDIKSTEHVSKLRTCVLVFGELLQLKVWIKLDLEAK